jgi:UDP-4-amino-4,6-dideoxy-N-acetyl-beta-L-altrosamine transaminase
MIPYGRHDIDEADVAAVVEVLRGDWLTTGPAVERFEEALAEWTGGVPAVSVSSGTAALHTAYAAAGLGPGDEVITPPITFVATQAALMHLGATPVFADVQVDTALIDPSAVEAAVTPRTKAIVAVDYAGHPADMDRLRAIADLHKLLLIEDAAHSLGSSYRGHLVGSLADITTFSFFPTKNITTGEGGAVVSRHPDILERARRFSRQGLVRDPSRFVIKTEGSWHQEVHEVGLNYRLTDVHAALGLSQLSRLAKFRARRAQIKEQYDEALSAIPGIEIPAQRACVEPMWHLYPLRVPGERRREIFEWLRRSGIGVQVNYLPAYRHPALRHLATPEEFPIAEIFYSREISLPLHAGLTDENLAMVCTAVAAGCREFR